MRDNLIERRSLQDELAHMRPLFELASRDFAEDPAGPARTTALYAAIRVLDAAGIDAGALAPLRSILEERERTTRTPESGGRPEDDEARLTVKVRLLLASDIYHKGLWPEATTDRSRADADAFVEREARRLGLCQSANLASWRRHLRRSNTMKITRHRVELLARSLSMSGQTESQILARLFDPAALW